MAPYNEPQQHEDIRFRLRRDSASEWVRKNPILLEGEPGLETNSRRVKYGDGISRWTELQYSGGGATGSTDFVHVQSTPSATWIVDHNLGRIKDPVVLLDSAPLIPVWTDVEHGSINQTTIIFPSPVSGKAYL